MNVPKLNVPTSKLEKLADDLKKLEVQTVVQVGGGTAIPAFQKQGYLEKLGHNRSKWFKRFFVLRDSFLLSYNLQKSDFTVEPRAAIHMGNATIQLVEDTENEKPFCFLITTQQQDKFMLSAEKESEREEWVRFLDEARRVTHANMIKLAVENQCLADEKGASQVARDNSTSALAVFSNEEYIKSTPITGGAEGWLKTTGFNPDEAQKGLLSKSKSLSKCYFILRDSHLLMFHGGDILTKPRGAMYLLGTKVVVKDEEGAEGFHFTVRSDACGDEIGLAAASHKTRQRWVQALTVGARVTFPDYQLLLREHGLLSAVTMTPRAAPPKTPNQPAARLEAPPTPLLAEDFDIQGNPLDAATQQAFDKDGNPILRTPEGQLVDVQGQVVDAKLPRFGANGEQLDPFNRPLPPGAVPMFSQEGVPIGVGPDGQHYLPDGTEVPKTSDTHFDAEGKPLAEEAVVAASAVATNINVAIKARQMLRGDHSATETVDVLGRTFRESTDKKSGESGFVNADGQVVPIKSARQVTVGGKLTNYNEAEAAATTGSQQLLIKVDQEGDEREIGSVEVDSKSTLKDVRAAIVKDLALSLPDFVFLVNQVPLLKYEERDRLAFSVLPEVIVRGKELKPVEVVGAKGFARKIEKLQEYEDQKKKEQSEFDQIMAQVRQGRFLKSAKETL